MSDSYQNQMQQILRGFEDNKHVLDGRRIFLVCRSSFDKLGISIYINSLNPVRFSDFTPNPKMEEVLAGKEAFSSSEADVILAVGGGSAIDVAKCIKYYGKSNASIIVIPTTSGTGSESTHFAVVYEGGEKKSVADMALLPDIAILEPATLKNVPSYTRRATMLDALCHAVESHWSKRATCESKRYAEEAVSLIVAHKDSYLFNENAGNEGMMNAANLAGRAINITTTTAAHAMCYKLTSMYGLQHGHAAALCLAEVMKYIDSDCGITRKDFVNFLSSLDLARPESASIEKDTEILASSVNLERLSNSPVDFSKDDLIKMYRNIIIEKEAD